MIIVLVVGIEWRYKIPGFESGRSATGTRPTGRSDFKGRVSGRLNFRQYTRDQQHHRKQDTAFSQLANQTG